MAASTTKQRKRHNKRTKNSEDDLLNYNEELVMCIEEMREKRDIIQKSVVVLNKEKNKLQSDLVLLRNRLAEVNERLCRAANEERHCDQLVSL